MTLLNSVPTTFTTLTISRYIGSDERLNSQVTSTASGPRFSAEMKGTGRYCSCPSVWPYENKEELCTVGKYS